jgi:hypothetical protein
VVRTGEPRHIAEKQGVIWSATSAEWVARIWNGNLAASWLSKHFTYRWLEQQGHRRLLIDADGL